MCGLPKMLLEGVSVAVSLWLCASSAVCCFGFTVCELFIQVWLHSQPLSDFWSLRTENMLGCISGLSWYRKPWLDCFAPNYPPRYVLTYWCIPGVNSQNTWMALWWLATVLSSFHQADFLHILHIVLPESLICECSHWSKFHIFLLSRQQLFHFSVCFFCCCCCFF